VTSINQLRMKGTKVVCGLIAASAAALLLMSLWQGALAFGLCGLALAVLPVLIAVSGRHDLFARLTVAATLPVYGALFVAVARDTAWQLDLHMIFFAYLAALVIMADWRAIIAATAVIALHHLVLNFAAPTFVFPTGASLARVALHASIVITETAILVVLCQRIEALVSGIAKAQEEQRAVEERAKSEREAEGAQQRAALDAFKAGLARLAEGDLTVSITGLPKAYREFEDDFNSSIGRLNSAIGEILDGIEMMNSGTAEISSASGDLSRRTEEQAANLEQTAAAIKETSERVRETAGLAKDAKKTIEATKNESDEGSRTASQAVNAMERIEQSSGEIASIVAVIDSIAFQTNLLALNAGVEAARAGETGKGFAVVASEVRALAQRCAEAADDVKTLVQTSGEHVASGAELVKRSGNAFATINASVSQLAGSIEAIAGSSGAQAENLDQIDQSISTLDRATQQNAAMAEECTATATSLAGQAKGLAGAVGSFKAGAANCHSDNPNRSRRANTHYDPPYLEAA